MIQLNPLRWRERAHEASYRDFERILNDADYWEAYSQTLAETVRPVFSKFYFAGAKAAAKFPEVRAILTDELADRVAAIKAEATAVNPDLLGAIDNFVGVGLREVEESLDYWVQDITKATKNEIQKAIALSHVNGEGSPFVLKRMESLFSPVRAHRIAVTETTRFYGTGAQSVYKAAKLPAWEWLTVADAHVCSVCTARNGNLHRVSNPFNPAHVNCRCFPGPVTEVSENLRDDLPYDDDFDDEPFPVRLDPGPFPAKGFRTLDEAHAWASARYPHIEWSFEGVHMVNLNDMLRVLDDLMGQFPHVAERYSRIGTRPFLESLDNRKAYAWQRMDGSVQAWNPDLFGRENLKDQLYRETLKQQKTVFDRKAGQYVTKEVEGWGAAGTGTPGGVVAHEFGHAVDGFYTYSVPSQVAWSPGVRASGDGLVTTLWQGVQNVRAQGLAEYGKKNAREKFAEAFAQRTMAPKEMWNPYTTKIDSAIKTVDPANWRMRGEWEFIGDMTPEARAAANAQIEAGLKGAGLKAR